MKMTFTIAALVGFVIGAVCACYKANEASAAMQLADVVSISSVASMFAREQYEHADGAHARQAVLLEIKILEQLERAVPEPDSGRQLGFAYTRLAMIEATSGHEEAESHALDQAREQLKLTFPRKELTDDQMKKMLKLLDAGSYSF